MVGVNEIYFIMENICTHKHSHLCKGDRTNGTMAKVETVQRRLVSLNHDNYCTYKDERRKVIHFSSIFSLFSLSFVLFFFFSREIY